MKGSKRQSVKRGAKSSTATGSAGAFESVFLQFSTELDEHYDLQERIYKAARDVTIEAKRVGFLLHRYQPLQIETHETLWKQVEDSLTSISQILFDQIFKELYNNPYHYYRYLHKFSFGLEELIEQLSFYYYLRYHKLISKKEVEDLLWNCYWNSKTKQSNSEETMETDSSTLILEEQNQWTEFFTILPMITVTDFVMGISDLGGELMRHATYSFNQDKSIATRAKSFLQEMEWNFISLNDNQMRNLSNKKRVLVESTQKVEKLCYMIQLQMIDFAKYNGDVPTSQIRIPSLFDNNQQDVNMTESTVDEE